MIVFPTAKINIGLYITEKRADGFHNIESFFYPTKWQDVIEIMPSEKLSFQSYGIDIDCPPEKNICYKAYEILKRDFNIPSISINLLKNIPIGAGLGGGSSDASFVLLALNEMFDLNIEKEQLKKYAGVLGSDCPFFIDNAPALVYGTGDIIQNHPIDLSDHFILIVYPNLHVNTGWAFKNIEPKPAKIPIKEAISQDVNKWKANIHNDFEIPLFNKYGEMRSIKENLYESGAIFSLMSGSGSSLFGIFNKNLNNSGLEKLKKSFHEKKYKVFQFDC